MGVLVTSCIRARHIQLLSRHRPVVQEIDRLKHRLRLIRGGWDGYIFISGRLIHSACVTEKERATRHLPS